MGHVTRFGQIERVLGVRTTCRIRHNSATLDDVSTSQPFTRNHPQWILNVYQSSKRHYDEVATTLDSLSPLTPVHAVACLYRRSSPPCPNAPQMLVDQKRLHARSDQEGHVSKKYVSTGFGFPTPCRAPALALQRLAASGGWLYRDALRGCCRSSASDLSE